MALDLIRCNFKTTVIGLLQDNVTKNQIECLIFIKIDVKKKGD